MLKAYDKESHPVGEKISDPVRVYRVRVVSTFMKSGMPIYKIDDLRSLLEESGFQLTGSQHLRELIPCILNREKEQIKGELSEKKSLLYLMVQPTFVRPCLFCCATSMMIGRFSSD